jgi:antitoxin component of RelBE/YafQ-DinJ toxin-antitoxin module
MPIKLATKKAPPFEARVPNIATVRAMQSVHKKRGKRFRSAEKLFEDLGI